MQRSQTVRVVVLAGALLAGPAAWAGTGFLTYDGWDSVQQGRGGEKKVVAGVDFWMQGSPPRRFKILGSIDGPRRKGGLGGMIAFSSPEDGVAKQARDVGADAVILTDAQAPHYLVVKYLPDAPDAAPYEPPPQPALAVRY
ncbi:MAG TPA: hypothetical protein VKQ70_12725 [Caulobacteraceae bacterium]|jgi:hypothetical protein|nr:hypothetical protein [Caulobacteraceae bacterium]